MSTHSSEQHTKDEGYERSDVQAVGGLWMSVVFIVLLILTLVFLYEYFTITVESDKHRIQMEPQNALYRDVSAKAEEQLSSYGVADSANGTYRIPILSAMEHMADSAFRARTREGGSN